jgi:poly-gamma-glutamate capsule biosynthesis protein CapA/YwtB (metallophosphatase superfamily)
LVRRPLALLLLSTIAGCGRSAPVDPPGTRAASADPPPAPSSLPSATRRDEISLVAGGDISFGRLVGQMLLRDPGHDFFAHLHPWLDTADLRFANLEGPLSDQRGETVKPGQPLVFTGPPGGADALARAGLSIVSTANNHAWDYGEAALRETLVWLDRAGVRHVGTGTSREASRRAEVIDAGGFRVAFLAVTDVWNDGPLARHPADAFVGRADPRELVEGVRALREEGRADAILVSCHGGEEYRDDPLPRLRELFHAAIDAGATAVLGHHPHVVQGVEWYRGRPILYSMGNLLMRMHRDHPWTGFGYLARLSLRRGEAPGLAVCPFRILGVEVIPLAEGVERAAIEPVFFDHLRSISRFVGGTAVEAPGTDGCARLAPGP